MTTNQLNVTMATVAREAGVSRATASRVLNGDTRVAPASVKRVREAAARLGYVRNAAAAQLARRQSGLVGLLLRDATNPAYAYLQDALITHAKERGLFLVTVSTGRSDLAVDETFSETSHILRFLELRPAGIIVASGIITADDVLAIAAQVPTLVMPRPEPRPELYTVGYDEEASSRMVAELVARQGHRRVAVVHNHLSGTEFLRYRVIVDTLAELGVQVVVIEGEELLRDDDLLADRLVVGARGGAYTCVMFPNDTRAVRFLVRARARGLSVPKDLSVTGLDGWGDAVALSGLTTVRNPIEEVARVAVETIEALIGGEQVVERKRSFPGTLIAGRTLADLGSGPVKGSCPQEAASD